MDSGHEFEAQARQWAEEVIGEEMPPAVASLTVDGLPLSASYDGLAPDRAVTWEHKRLNKALQTYLDRGMIPDEYKPQLEQGLMIVGARKCLFMASNGDRDSVRWAWYKSDPALRAKIIPAWKQFQADVAAYKQPEYIPAAVATPTADLPVPVVTVNGSLAVGGNLPAFGEALTAFIAKIPKKPSTDQEFADAAHAVKKLEAAEDALKAAKKAGLEQTTTVADMVRTIDALAETARQARLALSKLVEKRKQEIRYEQIGRGKQTLADHIAALNDTLPSPLMPAIEADFAEAIARLKTVDTVANAIDTLVSQKKIEANEAHARILKNLKIKSEFAADWPDLFPDLKNIINLDPEYFMLVVNKRIADARIAEDARIAAAKTQPAGDLADQGERPGIGITRADHPVTRPGGLASVAPRKPLDPDGIVKCLSVYFNVEPRAVELRLAEIDWKARASGLAA